MQINNKYDSNVGFMANVAEIFDGDNSLISFYDFKPNVYSDQEFCRDSIDKISDDNNKISECPGGKSPEFFIHYADTKT